MKNGELNTLLYGDDNDAALFTGRLELLGTWEVARFLGVERSRVARWLSENTSEKQVIAEPVARLKSGPFWLFADIVEKGEAMYAEKHHPYGKTVKGREQWLAERRASRVLREAEALQKRPDARTREPAAA